MIETNTLVTNHRKGKKPILIEWPDSDFTVKDVQQTLTTQLSNVTIQNKINKALLSGELTRLEEKKTSGGKPAYIYRKSKQNEKVKCNTTETIESVLQV